MSYTIYGTPNCGYCVAAKQLLDRRGLPYTYHDILADLDAQKKVRELLPDMKTVPQVFNDDLYIGGYTELKESLAPDGIG